MAAPDHSDCDSDAEADADDNDTTQQHLVNQVLTTLWPGYKNCRYSACPNGMVEVDCPQDATAVSTVAVTKLHQAGLQPIVYLSRGCVAVAGPDHVPDAEARRQRSATTKADSDGRAGRGNGRKRKRDDDDNDDDNNPIAAVASSRMANLLRDLSTLDGYACPTVTASGNHSFCVQGLGSVVHGDVLKAVERWNRAEPQPAPAVPKMVYDFAMCQVRVVAK